MDDLQAKTSPLYKVDQGDGMTKVNIHEAKTNFSRLVERALAGEEIVIARGGKPLLKLVPLEGAGAARPIGLHRRTVLDDFERRSLEPLTDADLAAWERPELAGDGLE